MASSSNMQAYRNFLKDHVRQQVDFSQTDQKNPLNTDRRE